MISLSALVFDPNGALLLQESTNSDFSSTKRRIRKRATLDGGVVVTDAGHSYGDSTWTLVLSNPPKAVADALNRLLRLYQTLLLVTAAGAFLVVPGAYSIANGTLTLVLEVTGET